MRAGAKVGAFAAGLLVVGIAGAGVGALAGPIDTGSADHEEATHGDDTTKTGQADPGHGDHGASEGADEHGDAGYRLDLGSLGAELTFTVVGPDGHPVTAVEERHTKPLHLIVVGRDLVTYAHLHPTVDAAGTWSTPAPDLPAGSFRVVADVIPAGGPELALVADLTVPGAVAPTQLPAPSATAEADGLTATLGGVPAVGEAELAFTITDATGATVTPEPYLGARGHLVAFRTGDLAYSHVHPHDDVDGPIRFTAAFPTGGAYRLFLDVQVDGTVHTFAFTVEVPDHEHD